VNGPPLCSIGDDCRGQDLAGNQIPPRDVWDNGYLCGACRSKLERWISGLPALHVELIDALIPGNGQVGGKTSYRNGWPINPAALGLTYDIDHLLISWAKAISEKRGFTYRGFHWQADVTQLAVWLTKPGMITWVAHWEHSFDMWHEIADLHRRAYIAAYPNRDRKRFPLPRHRRRCPELDCGGDLYAIVAGESHAGTMIQCSSCQREWQPMEWFRLGRRILNTPQEVSA